MKKILTALIRFYKKHISPGIPSNCAYTPTCSMYALQALKKHNFFKAFGLIIYRIIRCNPFSKGGFDPVPDNKKVLKWLF